MEEIQSVTPKREQLYVNNEEGPTVLPVYCTLYSKEEIPTVLLLSLKTVALKLMRGIN